MGPGDYSAQDENLPARRKERVVHEPEIMTPEMEQRDLRDRALENSHEEFLDFETRERVKAKDMVNGSLYMTKSRHTFLFLNNDLVFYSKITPLKELQSSGVEVLKQFETNLEGTDYLIISCIGERGVPMVFGLRLFGENILPIIDFMAKPMSYQKNPLHASKAQADSQLIYLTESGTGKQYFGLFQEDALQKLPTQDEYRFSYSGTLIPLQPSKDQVIPLSIVDKKVPVTEYFKRSE